ncbi:MAG: DUF294 nucleotidyltransferase-like domain-containing protein [Geobacteraceae bacterium]|nr:DUF294 nucleotidyltransferase-like domain-containing protein [Geobacteraceae bacterium]
MKALVSAKGGDVLAWRAGADFAATFRQALLARLEFCRTNEAEALLSGAGLALDDLIAANDTFRRHCTDLLEEVPGCGEPLRLKALTTTFYAGLYGHVGVHHSAPAFYEFSTRFLVALSGSVIRTAHASLGLPERQAPQVRLIALGPAGRLEFSPFCPLQLMLVHSEAGEAERELLSRLGRLIHEGFEACGLLVDATVTPRNPEWSGSMPEWRQRLGQRLEQGQMDDLIDLCRLADQSELYCDGGVAVEFAPLCRSLLKECQSAMAFQVTRVCNLSHGIGMMGGLRLKKNGPYRGQFALRDNALQPLSAAVSVLALLKGLETSSTPERIREILSRHELDVDTAERLLQAWHALHELRLTREYDLQPDWSNEAPLHLNVGALPDSDQRLLRESLEAVGAIQRLVGQTFSSMED